jgi:cysteinyl-tRNA synthetase
MEAINDDLNMPRAMAIVQETLKADLDEADRLATVLDFDRVLALDLDLVGKEERLPKEVFKLIEERRKARTEKDWKASDRLRDEIQALGYTVQDAKDKMKVFKK